MEMRSVHLIENIQEKVKYSRQSSPRSQEKRAQSQQSNSKNTKSHLSTYSNPNSKDKLKMYARLVKQEISFNFKV